MGVPHPAAIAGAENPLHWFPESSGPRPRCLGSAVRR